MSSPLACMLCSIDPGAVNLVVPVAQATIITLPIFFRDQIKRGAVTILGRGRAPGPDQDPCLDVTGEDPHASEGHDTPST